MLAVLGAVLLPSCWCVVAAVVVDARWLCSSGRCRWRCGVVVSVDLVVDVAAAVDAVCPLAQSPSLHCLRPSVSWL